MRDLKKFFEQKQNFYLWTGVLIGYTIGRWHILAAWQQLIIGFGVITLVIVMAKWLKIEDK
jgi:hypothetical protein